MTLLIIGLAIFLLPHSVRIFAEPWHQAQRARMGEKQWKAAFSLLSVLGLALVVWGYGLARLAPVVLWTPPPGMRHVAGLLTLAAFILLAAANVPRNQIKARLHHPMVLGVQAWAVAHLLANGNLADLVLFGSFLVWALLSFVAARGRDRAAGTVYLEGKARATVITVAAGAIAWALFAFWLHGLLIGVRPFAVGA